jgi:sulfofructose kinase
MPPQVICLGHATLDTVVRVPRLPRSDERVVADAGAISGGGPAATAAVTLARLGVSVAFAGRVGDDAAGELIRAGLVDAGVDVTWLATVPGASPITAVLVEADGRRALVPTAGTMADPGLNRLGDDPAFVAACREAAWLHVDHVGILAVPTLRAAGIATDVSYDGGNPDPSADLCAVALDAPTEAALLARRPALDLHAAIEAALDDGRRLVVVTRGAAGALGAERVDGRTVIHEAPAPTTDVVSTLGAGDVFHGALLAALVERHSLPEALRSATTAAALACRALDGRSAIPTRNELLEALTMEVRDDHARG